jgi:hypothetical protein
MSLQVNATHTWHSDVRDHAACVPYLGRLQELFSRRKRMNEKSMKAHEFCGGDPEGFIVIDN